MPTITVLGGSAASVNPGRGCAGLLLQDDQTNLVLDLGPNTLLELRKHTDYRSLDGIAVTHLHLDHILDLFALRFALSYNPIKPEKKTPLWLPPEGLELFAGFANLFADPGTEETFFTSVFDLAEYDPASTVTIGTFEIRFMRTVHPRPCWAMRVTHGPTGRAIGYTGDTGPSAPLETLLQECAVVVSEATYVEPSDVPWASDLTWEQRGHLTATESGDLAKRSNAGHLVLVHTFDELDPDHQRELAAQAFNGPVTVGRAGTVLEW